MNNKNNCPEINIIDLIYVLLRRLWIMILVGSILAAALGGYKLSKRVKTYDILDTSTKLNESETDEQYQNRVQNINKARGYVYMISRVNTRIENQRDYILNSVYMNIDPDNEYQSVALISIELDNKVSLGMENVLLTAYERGIKSSKALENYAIDNNLKPEHLFEVIVFSPFVPDNKLNISDNDRLSAMNITVMGPTREFCDEVMSIIIDEVDSIYSNINSSVAKHSISVVGIQHIERIDDPLRNSQNNQIATIDNLQRQISVYNDSLDRIAKDLGLSGKDEIVDYFNTHDEVHVNGIPTAVSEKNVGRRVNIKPAIKYAIVGLFIGFAIVVVLEVLKYMFGKRVSTQAQFFCEFSNIRRIGVMHPTLKRSKFIRFIDIKSEDDSGLNSENNQKLIAYNFENITRGCDKVLITGVGNSENMKNAVSTLGLRGDFRPNVFNDPEILKNIHDYDAVVLIEQRNISLFKDIHNEIMLINNSGKDILGAIIL